MNASIPEDDSQWVKSLGIWASRGGLMYNYHPEEKGRLGFKSGCLPNK
jgi:hypothetical protein